MFTVLLEYTKKPANRLLIIIVFLTLYNGLFDTISILSKAHKLSLYLLNAVNELVASILGEIIFYKNFAALVYFIACLVFMILRNKVGQAILIVNFQNTSVYIRSNTRLQILQATCKTGFFYVAVGVGISCAAVKPNELIDRQAGNKNILRSSFDLGYP